MKVKTITVTAGVVRSRDYQAVRYELSADLEFEAGDNADAVTESARRLFADVNEVPERAITHIAGQGLGRSVE